VQGGCRLVPSLRDGNPEAGTLSRGAVLRDPDTGLGKYLLRGAEIEVMVIGIGMVEDPPLLLLRNTGPVILDPDRAAVRRFLRRNPDPAHPPAVFAHIPDNAGKDHGQGRDNLQPDPVRHLHGGENSSDLLPPDLPGHDIQREATCIDPFADGVNRLPDPEAPLPVPGIVAC